MWTIFPLYDRLIESRIQQVGVCKGFGSLLSEGNLNVWLGILL